MILHPVHGDIVDEAPQLAEALIVWLWRGSVPLLRHFFSEPHLDELRLLHSEYHNLRSMAPREPPADITRPFASPFDHAFQLDPQQGRLRYIYIFGNPNDVCGPDNATALAGRLKLALSILTRGIPQPPRSIALKHIMNLQRITEPVAADIDSATQMVAALLEWDERHPGALDHVYLVDRRDIFAPFV